MPTIPQGSTFFHQGRTFPLSANSFKLIFKAKVVIKPGISRHHICKTKKVYPLRIYPTKMNNEQVIVQLKTLKSIRPDQGWVFSTKAQILSQSSREQFSIMDFVKNRAFLVLPSMAIICIAGIFLYNNMISLQTASQEAEALEVMASNLNAIGFNVLQAVNDLENIQEPDKMVKVQQTVASAIANGERIVENVKKMVEEQTTSAAVGPEGRESNFGTETLAVVTQVEKALENMKQTYVQKQKSLAQQLIQDLKTKSLTENQKEILEQAQEYYDNQEFDQALIKAVEVGGNR